MNKKIISLIMLFILCLFIFSFYTSKLNFNDDIEKMGYKNTIIANYPEKNKVILSKKDNSEITQEEMDNIYEYFNSNYIKNNNYETNIIYSTDYKEIELEISKK